MDAAILSKGQTQKLRDYVQLLSSWRRVTDLISERGFATVWERHVVDSLRLQQVRPDALRWLDIGSGAGFPAVVISIMLAHKQEAQVHCIESDGRKCAFLRTVATQLQIPLKVHNARMETISPATVGEVDVVTARAFSTIQKILALADPYLVQGAIALLPRGQTSSAEIEQLDRTRYTIESRRNPGENGGVILQIAEKVNHRDGQRFHS